MNAADPVATLLSRLDRPEAPRREFADGLRRRLDAELAIEPRRRMWTRRRRALLVAFTVGLVLATAAAATYMLARDGAGEPRVAPPPAVLSSETPRLPAQLSFAGDGRVYLRTRNGEIRPIGAANGSLEPVAWSPAGSRLLVIRAGLGYAMGLDGSLGRPLSASPWAGGGAWSRDGGRVAFVTGSPSTSYRVVVAAGDGSRERVLAAADPYTGIRGPAWSPDGTRLAFAARIGGRTGLFVVSADGSGRPRLVVPNPAGVSFVTFTSVSWAPAQRLAFVDERGTFVVEGDGTGLRRVDSGRDILATWSPDGTRLAVARPHEIVVLAAGGRLLRRLPGCACVRVWPGFVPRLSWSPDGTLLAYSGGTGPGADPSRGIYVVRVADRRVVRVAASRSVQFDRPLWRPSP